MGIQITLNYNYYHDGNDAPSNYFYSPEGFDVVFTDDQNAQITSAWESLQDKICAAAESDTNTTVKLDRDYTANAGDYTASSMNKSLTIPTNKPVTIDLNGHTINRNLLGPVDNGNVIEVPTGANLTITDSSALNGSPGTGKITGGFSTQGGGGIHVQRLANLTIEGGCVTGNKTTMQGGGIYVQGNLTMTGGSIDDNGSSSDYSPTSIFTGDSYGGGIYVSSEGTISLSNASITKNHSLKAGGGIYLGSSAQSTAITNCTIQDNSSNDCGGGLYMDAKDKSLTIEGTVFEGNHSEEDGGGIYLQNGSITMRTQGNRACKLSGNTVANDGGGAMVTGGTTFVANNLIVEENTAEEGGGLKNYGTTSFVNCTIKSNTAKKKGGGVHNNNKHSSAGELTLEYCTISNNKSTSDCGGGVYSDKKLKIVGGTIGKSTSGSGEAISGNTALEYGGGVYIDSGASETLIEGAITMEGNTAANGKDLFLEKRQVLTLSGQITGTIIGTIYAMDLGIFTSNYGVHHGSTDPHSFFCTDNGAIPAILADLGDGKKEAKLKSSWPDLQVKIDQAATSGGTLNLEQSYTASVEDKCLTIPKNTTVKIDLQGQTLNRNLPMESDHGSVIEVPSDATLIIMDSTASDDNPGNGKITGGYSTQGGGIYVHQGGVLEIKGGTITGNKTTMEGGGIYVGGTLTMTGGAVDGNAAGKGYGPSTMKGVGDGGGIFVSTHGSISLSGATISNNTSKVSGGGICLLTNADSTSITNCLIIDNHSE